MSKKCSLISLGEINRYIVLIFIGAIFLCVLTNIQNESKFFKEENMHPIIYTITYTFGLSLSFVLFIFYRIYNKRNNENQLHLMIPVKNQTIGVKIKEKFLWLLFVSVIDFIANIFNFILSISSYLFISWASVILSLTLFSYLIFRVKLHKHHYISIIVIMILCLSSDISLNKFSAEYLKNNYLDMILIFFDEILLSLTYILYKYFMMKKYIQTYEIMLYEGLIESILSIITIIVTTYIGYLDDFYDYYNNLDSKEITIFIFLTLFQFAYHLMKFITIQRFTQYHVLLLSALYILLMVFITFDLDNILVSILPVILVIICLIMILIFLEIIQLNCFGLSYMTKKNIKIRAKLDSDLAEKGDDNESRIDYQDYTFDLNGRKLTEMIELDSKSYNEE